MAGALSITNSSVDMYGCLFQGNSGLRFKLLSSLFGCHCNPIFGAITIIAEKA